MASFGFFVHPHRPAAAELTRELAAFLLERDHEVRVRENDATRLGLTELSSSLEELPIGLDLMVGIGGDGTMMRAVDIAAGEDVPVMGINAGQLGYLTTVEPSHAKGALKRFLSGAYRVEHRMRLTTTIGGVDDVSSLRSTVGDSLNEAFLEGSELGHTVRIRVSLDGDVFTDFVADGVIVATPTGSTAYAFSARGPIIDPNHNSILLVPVAPHMLFDRALVLSPETVVTLEVQGDRPAHLATDGRGGVYVGAGQPVTISQSKKPAKLVQFGTPNFHGILKDKFGLSER